MHPVRKTQRKKRPRKEIQKCISIRGSAAFGKQGELPTIKLSFIANTQLPLGLIYQNRLNGGIKRLRLLNALMDSLVLSLGLLAQRIDFD